MAGDERPDLELPSFLRGPRRRAVAPAAAPPSPPASPPVVEDVAHPSPPVVEEVAQPSPPVVEEVAQRPSRDLPPGLAVVATGLVVGLLAAGLVLLAGLACDAGAGTRCTGGPGVVVLLAVLAVATVTSLLLLRLWRVPEPGGTAVLALGLVAVLTLLLVDGELGAGWLLAALPTFSLVGHLVAHAVATARPGD